MQLREVPTGGVPRRWLLCFSHQGSGGWIDWVTFGKFKHVSAIGLVPGTDTWLFYDVRKGRTVIGAASGDLARRTIEVWTSGCTVVAIDYLGEAPSIASRLGFWCAPSIRHLIGLRCVAVRPQALFRAVIRSGGEVIASPTGPAGSPDGERGAAGAEYPAAGAAATGPG